MQNCWSSTHRSKYPGEMKNFTNPKNKNIKKLAPSRGKSFRSRTTWKRRPRSSRGTASSATAAVARCLVNFRYREKKNKSKLTISNAQPFVAATKSTAHQRKRFPDSQQTIVLFEINQQQRKRTTKSANQFEQFADISNNQKCFELSSSRANAPATKLVWLRPLPQSFNEFICTNTINICVDDICASEGTLAEDFCFFECNHVFILTLLELGGVGELRGAEPRRIAGHGYGWLIKKILNLTNLISECFQLVGCGMLATQTTIAIIQIISACDRIWQQMNLVLPYNYDGWNARERIDGRITHKRATATTIKTKPKQTSEQHPEQQRVEMETGLGSNCRMNAKFSEFRMKTW